MTLNLDGWTQVSIRYVWWKQNESSLDRFQMILGLFLNFCLSKSCVKTIGPLRALASFSLPSIFSYLKLELRENQTQSGNDCSEAGCRSKAAKLLQWYVSFWRHTCWGTMKSDLRKLYKTGNAKAVRRAACSAAVKLLSQVCAVVWNLSHFYTLL